MTVEELKKLLSEIPDNFLVEIEQYSTNETIKLAYTDVFVDTENKVVVLG